MEKTEIRCGDQSKFHGVLAILGAAWAPFNPKEDNDSPGGWYLWFIIRAERIALV